MPKRARAEYELCPDSPQQAFHTGEALSPCRSVRTPRALFCMEGRQVPAQQLQFNEDSQVTTGVQQQDGISRVLKFDFTSPDKENVPVQFFGSSNIHNSPSSPSFYEQVKQVDQHSITLSPERKRERISSRDVKSLQVSIEPRLVGKQFCEPERLLEEISPGTLCTPTPFDNKLLLPTIEHPEHSDCSSITAETVRMK